jgi:hypothetical protein
MRTSITPSKVTRKAAGQLPRGAKKRLDELSEAVASAHGRSAKLELLARFAVGSLADICVIHMVKRDGGIGQLLWLHCDPNLNGLRRVTPPPGVVRPDHPVRDVLRTGKPIFIAKVNASLLRRLAHDDAHHHILIAYGLSSCMFLPIVDRDAVVGTCSLGKFGEHRTFAEADLAVAMAGVGVVARSLAVR